MRACAAVPVCDLCVQQVSAEFMMFMNDKKRKTTKKKTFAFPSGAQNCEQWLPSTIGQGLHDVRSRIQCFLCWGKRKHTHRDTAGCYLESPLKSKQATRLWIDSLHSNMFAVQNKRKTWWHINVDLPPGCTGRMLPLTYLQNPLLDQV